MSVWFCLCVYYFSSLLVPTNTKCFSCRLILKWGFPIQAHSLTNLKWVRKFCQPQQHPTQLRLVRVHMTWHSCYASSPHYCFRLHVSLSLSLSLCAQSTLIILRKWIGKERLLLICGQRERGVQSQKTTSNVWFTNFKTAETFCRISYPTNNKRPSSKFLFLILLKLIKFRREGFPNFLN